MSYFSLGFIHILYIVHFERVVFNILATGGTMGYSPHGLCYLQ